jgi:hypothetical protein
MSQEGDWCWKALQDEAHLFPTWHLAVTSLLDETARQGTHPLVDWLLSTPAGHALTGSGGPVGAIAEDPCIRQSVTYASLMGLAPTS